MLIFQERRPEARRAGPQRALLLHRLGGRMARGLRPLRRVAAGAPDAPREGQRPARLQRRRVPLGHLLPAAPDRFAPHNLYTTARSCASFGEAIGAKDGPQEAAWRFGPDAPLAERPTGGRIAVSYPYNKITYGYDRKIEHLLRVRSAARSKQIDARDGERVAPKNVVIMLMSFGPLNDGTQQAPARGGRRRQGHGLDRDERPHDQGHVAQEDA